MTTATLPTRTPPPCRPRGWTTWPCRRNPWPAPLTDDEEVSALPDGLVLAAVYGRASALLSSSSALRLDATHSTCRCTCAVLVLSCALMATRGISTIRASTISARTLSAIGVHHSAIG